MDETKKVENWWNANPFTLNGSVGVGKTIEIADMDLAYFDAVEQRYLKQHNVATQNLGEPVFARYIDYTKLKGKNVLDIATGTGFSAVTFAQAGASVTAIDLTDFAVRTTKKNFEVRNLEGTILQMDAQKLKFPNNHFDFVCAHGCLMHMPDTQVAVSEIYRVLKPGGHVYAWMYHKGWHYWFGMMFLRGLLLGGFFRYGFSSLAITSRYSDGSHMGGNPHTKFMSRGEFKKLFGDPGFIEVKVVPNYNPTEWKSWPFRTIGFGGIFPGPVKRFFSEKVGFGYGCSIVGKKPIESQTSEEVS